MTLCMMQWHIVHHFVTGARESVTGRPVNAADVVVVVVIVIVIVIVVVLNAYFDPCKIFLGTSIVI